MEMTTTNWPKWHVEMAEFHWRKGKMELKEKHLQQAISRVVKKAITNKSSKTGEPRKVKIIYRHSHLKVSIVQIDNDMEITRAKFWGIGAMRRADRWVKKLNERTSVNAPVHVMQSMQAVVS
jgi:hypothetical protein